MKQYCVTGMSCAACAARVEKAVSAVPGVTSVSVSLLTNAMGVEGTAADGEIIRAVQDAGYGAYFIHRTGHGIGLGEVLQHGVGQPQLDEGAHVVVGERLTIVAVERRLPARSPGERVIGLQLHGLDGKQLASEYFLQIFHSDSILLIVRS